jgi:hypothetical protein
LTLAKINTVRAAFKAGVTPSRIARHFWDEAGRRGPYCLGQLVLRHWIDVKGVRLIRRDHACARQKGRGVYGRNT